MLAVELARIPLAARRKSIIAAARDAPHCFCEAVAHRARNAARRRHAGVAKLPGLFSLAHHSGVRRLLADDSARRTPLASRSVA